MLRTWGLIGACALLVSGCASMRAPPAIDGSAASVRIKPIKCEVDVWVLDGNIIVGHEPVHAKGCPPGPTPSSFIVTWQLREPSPYRFSGDPLRPGIEFKSVGAKCELTASARTIRCELPRGAVGTKYPYIVRVLNGNTPLPDLDPTILNN